jgi:hypothetical protein
MKENQENSVLATLNLSPEQLAALTAEVRAKDAAASEAMASKKEQYVAMRDNLIAEQFNRFLWMRKKMEELKVDAFKELNALIEMKAEAFGEQNQKSHTFTNARNTHRIVVNNAAIVSFDDTASAGAAKIKAYINTLASSENQEIIEMLVNLLGPDREGNLNPRKMTVLFDLKDKMARKAGSEGRALHHLLADGVEIIRNSMRYNYSATYIDVQYRRAGDNKWETVALNFASMPVEGQKDE